MKQEVALRHKLIWGWLFSVLSSAACTPPAPALAPVATPAEGVVTALGRVALQAPFKIVLPTFLPHGIQLAAVSLQRPTEGLSEEGRRKNARVELSFRNADGSASFRLFESLARSELGDKSAVPVKIGTAEGWILEDKERQLISLSWARDDIGFVLMAQTAGKLTRDEVVLIASSTLDAPMPP